MRILRDVAGQRDIVELRSWRPEATLRDLVPGTRGMIRQSESYTVDGRDCSAASPISSLALREGSILSDRPRTAPEPSGGWRIALSGGLDVVPETAVPECGALTIGRAPEASLTAAHASVSWRHCAVEREAHGIRLRDLGSTNGTLVRGVAIGTEGVWADGEHTVAIGDVTLSIRPGSEDETAGEPAALGQSSRAGTVPFNRPPQPGERANGEHAAADRIQLPTRHSVPGASSLNLVSVLLPLIVTGVLVVVIGDLRIVLFALLSPLLAMSTHVQQRCRRRRALAAEAERFAGELDRLRAAVALAAHAEVLRLRERAPEPAVVVRRALLPSILIWQRREGTADFLRLHVGTGDLPGTPAVAEHLGVLEDSETRAILESAVLCSAPVCIDLSASGVVGIVGERSGSVALARSLILQAAVHCGPADLTIGVCCSPDRRGDWEWAGWLPHTRIAGDAHGARWLAAEHDASLAVLRALRAAEETLVTPTLLLVIDADALLTGAESAVREALGADRRTAVMSSHGVSAEPSSMPGHPAVKRCGVVFARTRKELPASCTVLIEVAADASARVYRLDGPDRVEQATIAGVGVETAEAASRSLARFEDPELREPGAVLPSRVRLGDLLGEDAGGAGITGEQVRQWWAGATSLATPVGMGENGAVHVDLIADGPHGLVGGTTGSGKSEFLRSLVVGLALHHDPERLNFILIDFKGGAAFAACERLPHTVGTISNLDAQLAERALRSLRAELERRQRLFAAAGPGVDTLDRYLDTSPQLPMPRLVLVIDEFAMLAQSFPEVLSALVSIAAVGRTLGVHMVLATQRPAGVVTEDILANTNLRVALRVQSRDDSSSVIGDPRAAGIARQHAGRAYVRLGQGDTRAVQTALVTGRSPEETVDRVELWNTGSFGVPLPVPPVSPDADSARGTHDLDELIDVVVAAHADAGGAPPRPVWAEPLRERVSFTELEQQGAGGQEALPRRADPRGWGEGGSRSALIPVALADEPDLQRQSPAGWDRSAGNLILTGIPGSGTTTALVTIGVQLARDWSPEHLDLLCLDLGGGGLAPLAQLPHTAAYVGSGPDAQERQLRFLRYLDAELRRRRTTGGPQRAMVVLIDGFAALRETLEDPQRAEHLDTLTRVYTNGPAVGLHIALSTARARAVPAAWEELTTQRWVFRLPDSTAYAAAGLRAPDHPAPVPGRCVDLATLRQQHIATPGVSASAAVSELVSAWGGASPNTDAVGVFPARVAVGELAAHLELDRDPIRIPVGIREDTLHPACLELYDGEHALIAGPSRSGKTSLLLAIAELVSSGALPAARSARDAGGGRTRIWAVCNPRSPLRAQGLERCATRPGEIPLLLRAAEQSTERTLLLVDDAERIQDSDGSFGALLAAVPQGVHLIVAARAAELRSRYGHWTGAVRAARCGVLLQPDVDADGELLGVRVPRRAPVEITPGRGYLCVGGDAALLHAVSPGGGSRAVSTGPVPHASSGVSETPGLWGVAPTLGASGPPSTARSARAAASGRVGRHGAFHARRGSRGAETTAEAGE